MFALEATSCKGPGFADCCPQVSSSSPEVFGPPLWFSLHTMAAKYPEAPPASKQQACSAFVTALPEMLPCDDCSDHFKAFLEESDLTEACSSREKLSELLCRAHNKVNERLGKPTVQCEGVIGRYASSALCPPSDKNEASAESPDVERLVDALRAAVMAGMQYDGAQSVCGASACDA